MANTYYGYTVKQIVGSYPDTTFNNLNDVREYASRLKKRRAANRVAKQARKRNR